MTVHTSVPHPAEHSVLGRPTPWWVGGWGEKRHVTGSERKRPGVTPPPGGVAVTCQVGGPAPHSGHPCPPCRTLAPLTSGQQELPSPSSQEHDPGPTPRGHGRTPGKAELESRLQTSPLTPPLPRDRWGNGGSESPACWGQGRARSPREMRPNGAHEHPGGGACSEPLCPASPTGLSPAPWPPGPRPAPQLSQRPRGHPPLSRASSSPAKGAESLGEEVLGTRPWKGPSPTSAETLLTHLWAARTAQIPRSPWHRLSRPQVSAGSAGPGRGGRWVGPGEPPSPAGLPAELQGPVPASQPSRGGPGGPTPAGRSLLLPGRARVLVTLAPTSAPPRGTATSKHLTQALPGPSCTSPAALSLSGEAHLPR